jgi:YHS domain-containing protein
MKKALLLLAALALLTCVSAAVRAEEENAPAPAAESAAKECSVEGQKAEAGKTCDASAKVGGEAICPVEGSKFTITEESPCSMHGEECYFFCCSDCKVKFDANPEEYVK